MKNSLRTRVGRMLNVFGLRKVARRINQSLRAKRFRADNSETPLAVERALQAVHENGVSEPRDYYEFGLYQGYTLWYAQQSMTKLGNRTMRFFGFDSFEGFPEVHGPDAYKGDFSKGQFTASVEYVRNLLTEHAIDWDRAILVPGYYQDTLNDELKRKHSLLPAAVVLIDCVLYESTCLVLEFISGLLADGSMLVFDDWNAFDSQDDHGERRAFHEFLHANRSIEAIPAFEYGMYGKAFTLRISSDKNAAGEDHV